MPEFTEFPIPRKDVADTTEAHKTAIRTALGAAADAALDAETATRLAADNRRAYKHGFVVNRTGSSTPQINGSPWPLIGTSDFALVWDGSTIDTTAATKTIVLAGGGSNVLQVALDRNIASSYDAGSIKIVIGASSYVLDTGSDIFKNESVWSLDFDRDGNATLYRDGVSIAEVSISTSSAVDLDSPNVDLFYLNSTGWLVRGLNLFNRALSSDEHAELAEIGIGAWLAKYPEDQWGDSTALTSGTLEVGQRYRIATFVTGDDFTNVGAASNATGVEFVATGTTPTTWTNGSSILPIGTLAAYPMDEGIGRQPRDLSGRYDALLSATGFQHMQPKTEGYVRVKGADADPAMYMLEAGDIIPADSVVTDIIAEERKVAVANTAQDLADNRIRLNPSGSDLQIQRSDGTNHTTLGTVTAPTSLDDIDAQVHYKQVIR